MHNFKLLNYSQTKAEMEINRKKWFWTADSISRLQPCRRLKKLNSGGIPYHINFLSFWSFLLEKSILSKNSPAWPRKDCRICCICLEPTLSTPTRKHLGYSSKSSYRNHTLFDELNSNEGHTMPLTLHQYTYQNLSLILSILNLIS